MRKLPAEYLDKNEKPSYIFPWLQPQVSRFSFRLASKYQILSKIENIAPLIHPAVKCERFSDCPKNFQEV